MKKISWNFTSLIKLFQEADHARALHEGLHGLEREALRVTSKGDLALTPHPEALGQKEDNPLITTDFSESQVELITEPLNGFDELLSFLERETSFTVRRLGHEFLWPMSMPCRLPKEELLPIARFKKTPEGKAQEIYREGLAQRYGKMMQMVSGIHYNVSFSENFFRILNEGVAHPYPSKDFRSESYLSLLRNFVRNRYLLIYLFGNSPIHDETYECQLMKSSLHCDELKEDAKRYAVSIRTSRCGYNNPAKIKVGMNSIKEHWHDLKHAISTPHEPYKQMGLFKNGKQIQLNDHLLQIPSEYYFPIRLKPILEDPVQYIELRLFDADPMSPLGIKSETLYFARLFVLYCCLNESPDLSQAELDLASDNQQAISFLGRKPNIKLKNEKGETFSVQEFSQKIMDDLAILAELLDKNQAEKNYSKAVLAAAKKIANPELLESEQFVKAYEASGMSFVDFGLELAKKHRDYLISLPDDPSFFRSGL